jgi:hypothetical protein
MGIHEKTGAGSRKSRYIPEYKTKLPEKIKIDKNCVEAVTIRGKLF